jgi:peptide/nickel transport system permease protein
MKAWPISRLLPLFWLLLWFVPATGLAVAYACGLAPALAQHHLAQTLQSALPLHPLGFDAFGRDLLLTTLRASVTSALFAAFATLSAALIGTTAGTLIAVSPEGLRFVFLRGLESLLAFPALLFALAWAAVRGPGWDTLMVALLLGSVPPLTRLLYARTRELMSEDYVTAARSLGASRKRIAYRHLAPGVVSLCRVKAPNLFASALMAEATLSFLGIGAPIGRDTWGALLAQGKDYLIEAPHLALGSGLPLVLTILSLQILSTRPKLSYDLES